MVKRLREDRAFSVVCTVILLFFLAITLYPILYVVSSSFSSGKAVGAGKVVLFPVDLSLEGYLAVFRNKHVIRAYGNTIVYTCFGTVLNVAIAMFAAYPLARKTLPGRNFFTFVFAFTMYFGGGLIPSYMLIRDLGMIDTLFALIFSGALSVYNMILARTFIQSSIPMELMEAAKIDGSNNVGIFFRIVVPLSKAILAVLAIYSMVGHWNGYFSAMLYLNSMEKMPLQIILKQVLVSNIMTSDMMIDPELEEARAELANVLKFALIVVSTAPIMCIYPFMQKYFVQGVMIGSLKG